MGSLPYSHCATHFPCTANHYSFHLFLISVFIPFYPLILKTPTISFYIVVCCDFIILLELLTFVRFDNPTILPFFYDTDPPWNITTPPVCTHLSSMPKFSTTLPREFRGSFLPHSFSHPNSLPAYTDGTKVDNLHLHTL